MIDTLELLHVCFSKMMKSWKRFEEPNGDLRYFSDIVKKQPILLLAEIRETFQSLEDLEQTLALLDSSCKKWHKSVRI